MAARPALTQDSGSKRSNPAASLNLGLIGNCQVASLIDAQGTHVWTCLPRLDGDPAFCELLAGSNAVAGEGRWAVQLLDQVASMVGIVNCAMRLSRSWEDAL